jgi:hypothetical protein
MRYRTLSRFEGVPGMARVKAWWTVGAVSPGYVQSFSASTHVPEGTILRVVGTVQYDTNSPEPPDSQWLGLGWQFNVGVAPDDPLHDRRDPDSIVIRKLVLLPASATRKGIQLPGNQEVLSEGRRIVAPGETMWFAYASFQANVAWLVSYELRVLMLLPEGVP